MHKLLKGPLFIGLCVLAAWLGSTVQTAADVWGDYKCYYWVCQGTVDGCILRDDTQIAGCYSEQNQSCTLTGYMGTCYGLTVGGQACIQQWPSCYGAAPP